MNTSTSDMDPLSEYDYSYTTYGHVHPSNGYLYNTNVNNIKTELPQPPPGIPNLDETIRSHTIHMQIEREPDSRVTDNKNEIIPQNVEEHENATNKNDKEDSKDDIKPLIQSLKGRKHKRGKTSSYWNKKISDTNFPFYGCTICNISFTAIQELDQHITVHKGRLTSYDLRLKNQLKKKLLKREQKKLKKLGKKVKTEFEEIEIKPEDGYIGNETASDFLNNTVEKQDNKNVICDSENNVQGDGSKQENDSRSNGQNKDNLSSKSQEIMQQYKEILQPQDPRLHKLFKCFACQKQFSLSYYLKLHVRSHTDEKPYTCAECGQSFITASKLSRHNKRIHLAIRYQCRICYRFFSRFDYLTRHFDKKHPDDKLEGEPYDYNAILPYLKELEEQLKDKSLTKEEKPKTEDLWSDWPIMDHIPPHPTEPIAGPIMPVAEPKNDTKDEVDNKDFTEEHVDVVVEVPVVSYEYELEIKKEEVEDNDADENDVKDHSFQDDNFKDDCGSDSDYFPLNTWASKPKVEPEQAVALRRRYKRSEFPRQCELCDKIINSASYMKVHLRTHTGEKPFKCYICGRGFITSSKMHRHVLIHEEALNEDGDDVKEEVKQEDGDGEEGKKKGRRKSRVPKELAKGAKRRRKGHQKRPYMCPFCNKRFLHKETMEVHKKSHDGEEIILKCNFCLEVMEDDAALASHEATHTGPKPYLCTLCGKSYTKRESMVYHRKGHDEKERKEFVCDMCPKTFNAQCKLQRHIVGHRVDKFVLRYECPVCAHMFNTKYHIQMHLSTHQKEGLILEENRNEILAMVMQNARKIPRKTENPVTTFPPIPSDERSRVCNICGQVFQHFYYLEEHLKSHGSKIALEDDSKEEEKKHICKVCNKGFKLHYYLKLHNFTHSKEKPYICQQCGKGFITKGKLKRHLETHSGLKKYQCHICYKFFTRPSYLRIHVRTIHGTQDYNFRLDKGYMPLLGSV